MKAWLKYLLLAGAFNGYLLGVGKPLILLWSETSMFNIVYQWNSTAAESPVRFGDFQSVALNSLYLCFESILFCSLATFCLTYYFAKRKSASSLTHYKQTPPQKEES